jgi:hypothetical protein
MSAAEHLDAILAPIPHDFDDGQISERLQEHYFGASAELAKLRAELARLRAIEQAANTLLVRMNDVYDDLQYQAAFMLLADHQEKYTGKKWTAEQDALAAALEAKP